MYNNDSCDFPSPTERVREKLRSSICCFRSPHIEGVAAAAAELDESKARTPRGSPYVLKDKCKSLIARIGKGSGRKHFSSSADFSYDPLSYALNFEDESSRADELPFLNFTSRLPATPERTSEIQPLAPVSTRREIFAFS